MLCLITLFNRPKVRYTETAGCELVSPGPGFTHIDYSDSGPFRNCSREFINSTKNAIDSLRTASLGPDRLVALELHTSVSSSLRNSTIVVLSSEDDILEQISLSNSISDIQQLSSRSFSFRNFTSVKLGFFFFF